MDEEITQKAQRIGDILASDLQGEEAEAVRLALSLAGLAVTALVRIAAALEEANRTIVSGEPINGE